jgi:hypothetical protein
MADSKGGCKALPLSKFEGNYWQNRKEEAVYHVTV